ncbi:hypothetical protein JRQ81_005678 [Phrynocephalus forsythii]|uniref:Ig-like domain-containing protein n=1 Tax=Phrynocephalus forsythii TaxID=171643 RepID=A0A9Q0XGW3_9SAUR|nr:hypothetical protein JRQ81_005678 [Phrynocephalus forsythii]
MLTCTLNGVSGTNYTTQNRTDENPKEHEYYGNDTDGDLEELAQTEVGLKLFPCDAPTSSNWTEGSLHWIRHNLMSRKETVLMNITIRRSSRFGLSMRSNAIFLIIPSVMSKDAGTYTCQGKNQKHSFQLEVTAKSNWILGDQHWIIWTVALGCTVVCVSSVLCFWWLKRVAHAHKKQMKKRIHGGRYFDAKRKKGHVSNGIPLPPAKQDATDDFSYENVIQDMGPRSGRQLLQKGKILPNHVNMEDEEEYENPDSETELKSDDGDNYENTQEEMKQEDVILNGDQLYENKTQEGPKILTQDLLDEADGENYENLENETSFSSGAARLIAGLRLQLDLDPQVDKQDGSSEASTGSQSYEEMNGSLSPSAMKSLLHPNTSNEEDGDSYENMESPNNFISRKEGNVDRSAKDEVFNSTWPNLSSPPAPNHKGGLLCSD